jgi:DNA-binding HxlR family transcriptional regulator
MNAIVAMTWTAAGSDDCPVADTLARLAGKYKPRLLHALSLSDQHFLELVRAMPGASRKMIAAQLRELVGDGLVLRQPQEDARRRVRYCLSSSGRDLVLVLGGIFAWSQLQR